MRDCTNWQGLLFTDRGKVPLLQNNAPFCWSATLARPIDKGAASSAPYYVTRTAAPPLFACLLLESAAFRFPHCQRTPA